jgi:hypothetical protein
VTKPESWRPIRIGLAVLPELARDLLHDTFARHRLIEVVDLPDGARATRTAADGCDVIVTTASRAADALGPPLHGLLERSTRNTLVVTIDGALVMMFEYRPLQQLFDPAPDDLVDAIREQVRLMKHGEA